MYATGEHLVGPWGPSDLPGKSGVNNICLHRVVAWEGCALLQSNGMQHGSYTYFQSVAALITSDVASERMMYNLHLAESVTALAATY